MNSPVSLPDPRSDALQVRVHGDTGLVPLIYLPGIHGDWTLVTDFRDRMKGRVQFVEFTYPRTVTWTLDDYATAVLAALRERGIESGWLLGESFSSQVAWKMLEHGAAATPAAAPCFRPLGLILAGGFVRYPAMPLVRLAHAVGSHTPTGCLKLAFRAYAVYARQRYSQTPEAAANVREFIRRRLDPADRQAVHHRLRLILKNDPRATAGSTRLPVYVLVALLDPVVPAIPVRRWLKRNCPGFAGVKIIARADHNVLGSAAEASARQITAWLQPDRR